MKNQKAEATVDVLVLGGALGAVMLAEELARQGKTVLLAERRIFLGYETGAYHCPWLQWDERYRDETLKWFPVSEEPYQNGREVSFSLDKYKLRLEERMLRSGVRLLYAVQPVAVKKEPDGYAVYLGAKSGIYRIQAKRIVDATDTAVLRYLTGFPADAAFLFPDTSFTVSRTAEFYGFRASPAEYEIPKKTGLPDCKMRVHASAFSAENYIVEFMFHSLEPGDSLEAADWTERQIKEKILSAYAFLREQPGWENVRFGVIAPQTTYREQPIIPYALEQASWGMNALEKGTGYLELCGDAPKIKQSGTARDGDGVHTIFQNGKAGPLASPHTDAIRIVHDRMADVAVCGGGTSGATAACSAADNGADTILIEMNDMPGGTGTVGGVHYYWYGRREGVTKEIDDEYETLARQLREPAEHYVWGTRDGWNPDLKAAVLERRNCRAGVHNLYGSLVCGVYKEANRVTGVLAATPYGLCRIRAKTIADTTGDADVVRLSGGEAVYGSEKDGATMWACLAQYRQSGRYRGGIFTTMADISDIWDYTRYILVNRQRGKEGCYDHGSYLAPRESRHIMGEYQITVKDIVTGKRYPDSVLTAFSNFDTKGKSWADLVYFGFLPSQLYVDVPYRALIPAGLEGLLTGGKAISATHDASSAVRMQDDMQNLGAAVGIAAAMAAESGSVRKIDLSLLQKLLTENGALLPPGDFMTGAEECYSALIDSLTGKEAFESIDMDMSEVCTGLSPVVRLCLADSREVLPLLRRAYEQAAGERKFLLAWLLLWHRDDTGIQLVTNRIQEELAEGRLPQRKGSTKFCQPYPDHGVMAEVSYLVCQLSRSPAADIKPVLSQLVNCILGTERDYLSREQCLFGHIESVAYTACRKPDTALQPVIEELLTLPEFENIELMELRYGEMDVDITKERIAYLKLLLAEAAARCGSGEGYRILSGFLQDQRGALRMAARKILTELLGAGTVERPQSLEAVFRQQHSLKPYQNEIW